MFGLPTEDDGSRDDVLLGQNLVTNLHYQPDIDALRDASTRIVVVAGAESEGELSHRGAEALAERLGTKAVTFPSDHGGFLGGEYGQTGDPEAFAAALRKVLERELRRGGGPAISYIPPSMQTFLFTDIEGSTRLWEEHGDAMAAALARHDEILNQAVAQAGGSVLKTTGDGMIAVFDSVSDSLSAAVDSQRALDEEQWGPTGPLRVRMGIHSGDTESREGDYFGPAMNRAARIMAAGHGGQVLVSGTSSASGYLPPGVELRDLGMHRLKDLTEPEHLYQVIHDALRSDFPAPRTLDGRPNNLPQQATEFLGREDELAAIHLMLESPTTRLLTVTGPGGAGKTRIGLQVAADELDHYLGRCLLRRSLLRTRPGQRVRCRRSDARHPCVGW